MNRKLMLSDAYNRISFVNVSIDKENYVACIERMISALVRWCAQLYLTIVVQRTSVTLKAIMSVSRVNPECAFLTM